MSQPDLFHPMQLVTLAVFLGTLIAVWYVVQRNKTGLARRIGQGKRITVAEVTAISPTDRAMILAVDGREYLVLRSKGTAPVVMALAGGQA